MHVIYANALKIKWYLYKKGMGGYTGGKRPWIQE